MVRGGGGGPSRRGRGRLRGGVVGAEPGRARQGLRRVPVAGRGRWVRVVGRRVGEPDRFLFI